MPDGNNAFANAQNLGVLTSARTLNRSIGAFIRGRRDLEDFYQFRLTGARSFSAALNGLRAGTDANITLYNAQRRPLQFSGRPGNSNELIRRNLGAGVYFVRVNARIGSTPYRLGLSIAPPDRAGNRLGVARNVGPLSRQTRVFQDFVGRVDPQDFYRFNVSRRGRTTIDLSQLRNANVDLALFNGRGQILRGSARAGAQSERIQLTLNPGNYFVRVLRRSGNTNYRLAMTSAPIQTGGSSAAVPGRGTYSLTATGTTFSGSTAFPSSQTRYFPTEGFRLPGRLTISPTIRFAPNSRFNGINPRDILFTVGGSTTIATGQAGQVLFASNTAMFRQIGGNFSQSASLDLTRVQINGGTMSVQVDAQRARQSQLNLFNRRTSILAAPSQVLQGNITIRFTNGGRNVNGRIDLIGGGLIEPGTSRYIANFTGVRRA
ncbi:MAG: PPC domain-containing protein [Cyanobacteria bacterium P01_F01_bin.13]